MEHELEGIDVGEEVTTPLVLLQRDVEKLRESKYVDSAAIVGECAVPLLLPCTPTRKLSKPWGMPGTLATNVLEY